MKHSIRLITAAATLFCSAFSFPSSAQLLNVVQIFPDTTATASPYLIYDRDGGGDSATGLLRLVSGATALNEGGAAGGSTITQGYFGAGDTVPDVLLSIKVRNGTGGFTAGSFVSGVVSVGFGNNATASRWKWDGTITALGSQAGTGTILDATWKMTGDQYQNLPANMNQFTNGFRTGGEGGIKIQSSALWGAANNFANDWVYGLNPPLPATNANLSSFLGGMTLTAQNQINSTITADIFVSAVPEPETTLMMLLGFALLVPLVRMRKQP